MFIHVKLSLVNSLAWDLFGLANGLDNGLADGLAYGLDIGLA